MEADDGAARARQRELVRRGYDAISLTYRNDDGGAAQPSAEDVGRYAGWVAELAGLLPSGARVLDLGCGAGIPATRELTAHGLRVMGVDFSAVQLRRARRLVPAASLVQADMTALRLQPASLDAVVSFYALIHVPLADQQALFPRIRSWLRPGGHFLAIVGAERWNQDRTLPRRRYVLGPRSHRCLSSLAPGSRDGADLAPLHPRRRFGAQPHPGPSQVKTRPPA